MNYLKIIDLIEDLLIENNYLAIPGFGGFVVRDHDFFFEKESNTIYPRKKILAFNKKLHADDGILIMAISENQEISSKKAKALLEEFVNEIELKIAQNACFSFGNIGDFILNQENGLSFIPNESINLEKTYFGLSSVSIGKLNSSSLGNEIENPNKVFPLEPVSQKIEEETEVEEKVISIHSSKSLSPYWAASVSFILGCLVTFFVTEPSYNSWKSSFNPMDLIPKWTTDYTQKKVISPKVYADLSKKSIEKGVKNPEIGKEEVKMEPPKVAMEARYYLIGGTFKTMKISEKGVEELKIKGIENPVILPKLAFNKNFKIAVDSSANLPEAEAKAKALKDKKIAVWIYKKPRYASVYR